MDEWEILAAGHSGYLMLRHTDCHRVVARKRKITIEQATEFALIHNCESAKLEPDDQGVVMMDADLGQDGVDRWSVE